MSDKLFEPEIVEAAARAICVAEKMNDDDVLGGWRHWVEAAEAALEAVAPLLVAREPTDDEVGAALINFYQGRDKRDMRTALSTFIRNRAAAIRERSEHKPDRRSPAREAMTALSELLARVRTAKGGKEGEAERLTIARDWCKLWLSRDDYPDIA